MAKVDLKKELKHLYLPSAKEPSIVEVPEMNFIMIDGTGNPNTAKEYQESLEALYALSYTLKFKLKLGPEARDFTVMPLEGLWWTDDMGRFNVDHKDIWMWTSMIMQPEFVTQELFEVALEDVRKKKDPPALDKTRLEAYAEGLSAQIMYIGPYSDEAPTIERLHAFIEAQGGRLRGKHHEIYLGDPRRTAPERLKTVIRQPMEKVE
jgi:hypothetical protein